MKRFDDAKEILDLLFESNESPDRKPPESSSQNNYFVISGQFGPRWLVPSNSRYGKSVLSDWRPYSLLSQIKWAGLRLAYSIGFLGKIPGVKTVLTNDTHPIPVPGMDSVFIPVVYIGTPGPQQKAIATMVSAKSGIPCAIMKVAMTEGARTSLKREAITIKKLSDANFHGSPTLLAAEENGARTWQTVVIGRLSPRKLTQAHIDWLLQLPRSGALTTIDEQQERLKRNIEKHPQLFGEYSQVALDAIFSIKGGKIPLTLSHGDFAPWNLKLQDNSTIAAIDWEDADWSSIPLWDLCHFFLIQTHLFKERNPIRKMLNNSMVRQYIAKIGIDEKSIIPLMLLYALLKASGLKGPCNESYKDYLLSQIPLMATP